MNPVAKRERHSSAIWLLIVAILVGAMVIDYLAPCPYVMTPLYALAVLVAAWRQARPDRAKASGGRAIAAVPGRQFRYATRCSPVSFMISDSH